MRITHGAIAVALTAALLGLPATQATAVPGGTASPPPLQCVDNGTSGNRVQVLYTYEPGTSRLAEREPVMRAAAWVAQQNINDSARRDGAQRWLKYLTTSTGCQLVINSVQVPAGSTNGGGFLDTLKAMGYNLPGRTYVILSENHRLSCAGTVNDGVNNDSTPSTSNLHNSKTWWITFQPSCFTGHTVTHELAHALGGVLPGAPHWVDGSHCNDGNETLCQDTATVACPDPLAVRMLDCGRDDYFAVNPQGSYLPTHFNAALHSLYLQAGSSVSPLTTIPPLAPQVLRATDVEGTSIAFSFLPSMLPIGGGYTMDYQLLRNGTVVATVPGWQTTVRLTGLTTNTSATYTVRHRITVNGTVRTSPVSQPLTVTTNSSTAPAGQAENGAVLMLTNDVTDPSGPKLAMDLYSFSENDNANIVQWPANGLHNQQWRLTTSGSGYTIRSQHSLKCLTPLNGGTAPGTDVVQSPCTGAAAQQWAFSTISGVTYQIRSIAANLCVQAAGAGTGGGTRLVLAACSTSEPTQRWTSNRIA
ncbi:RICIN domain-containing protein [Allorhizocola rhizosphaerae]|uniref:RICIN domain-containing protein n=1 Tax=Allorhizocola rhizosphaerae TaxID=1872709 RepID=UPI000E3E1FB4|nr:RICIN domain-containing protein [Allorhizocola rhizosphaerae]